MKKTTLTLREPYYKIGDGAGSLLTSAINLKDRELINLIHGLVASLDKVQEHMSDKYNWD